MEEAATQSKKKRSFSALSYLQDFMNASNHDRINWEDLTHNHMNQYFWGSFATYMVKYASNKTKVKFSDGNSSSSKKSAKSRKKQRQLLFSRIHSKCVQVQKQIFSVNFWAIRNQFKKRKQSKDKDNFRVSNDPLAYFYASIDFPA